MSWFVEFAFKCYILFFFYSRDENFQRSTFLKFLVTLDFLSKFIRPCIYIHFWRHDVALSLQSGNDGMEYIFLARDRARRKTILIVLPIFYVTQAAWAPPPTPSFSFSPTHPPPPCTFLCLVRLTQKWHCRCYRALPWTTLCCSPSVFEQYVTCCCCWTITNQNKDTLTAGNIFWSPWDKPWMCLTQFHRLSTLAREKSTVSMSKQSISSSDPTRWNGFCFFCSSL